MATLPMMMKGQLVKTMARTSFPDKGYLKRVFKLIEEPKPKKKLSVMKRTIMSAMDKAIMLNGYKNNAHPIKNFNTESIIRIINVLFCLNSATFNAFIA